MIWLALKSYLLKIQGAAINLNLACASQ
jgi:hypothetical protein